MEEDESSTQPEERENQEARSGFIDSIWDWREKIRQEETRFALLEQKWQKLGVQRNQERHVQEGPSRIRQVESEDSELQEARWIKKQDRILDVQEKIDRLTYHFLHLRLTLVNWLGDGTIEGQVQKDMQELERAMLDQVQGMIRDAERKNVEKELQAQGVGRNINVGWAAEHGEGSGATQTFNQIIRQIIDGANEYRVQVTSGDITEDGTSIGKQKGAVLLNKNALNGQADIKSCSSQSIGTPDSL